MDWVDEKQLKLYAYLETITAIADPKPHIIGLRISALPVQSAESAELGVMCVGTVGSMEIGANPCSRRFATYWSQ